MAKNEVQKPFDLVSGILEEAEREAAEITSEAEKDARRRVESAKKRAEAILSRQDKEIQQRTADIRREAGRRAELEIRRLTLKEQEELFAAVTTEAGKRLQAAVDTPEHREVLKGWIVEAAAGLETREAVVMTSPEEARHIDRELLKEIEEKVYSLTGRRTALSFDKDGPTAGAGVILSEKGNKRAFNNQVSTRLMRYRTAVRAAIHRELFEEL